MTVSTPGSIRDVLSELLTDEGLRDPYAVYAGLRLRQAAGEDVGPVVLDHAGAREALVDRRLSSRRVDNILRPLPPEARGAAGAVRDVLSRIVVFQDAPDHTRLRRLLFTAFSARDSEAMTPTITAAVDRLLDRFEAAGDGDLHRHVSYPLPAIVVAEMLGIPDADRERFERWALDLVLVTGSGRLDAALAQRFAGDLDELRELMGRLMAERRRSPGADLLSAMLAAEAEDGRLTEDEIVANALFLMTAGHETAANQTSNALLALLRHPEQADLLRDDPAAVPGMVDEAIRYDGAVQMTARIASEELEVAGHTVRPGAAVLVVLGAANRDPAAFEDPARFDITRPKGAVRQLGFGHGAHRCLGAALAQVEMRAAIPAVLRRYPGLRPAEADPPYQRTLDFRGPDRLLVETS